MKFDFPKKIRSGYLVVFLLLSLCYFLSLSSFIQLRKQNRWVGHTREVINKMGQLNTEMKDAEVKWEEYLINRERTYLQAYQESRILVDSIYHLLSVSVGDNPVLDRIFRDPGSHFLTFRIHRAAVDGPETIRTIEVEGARDAWRRGFAR